MGCMQVARGRENRKDFGIIPIDTAYYLVFSSCGVISLILAELERHARFARLKFYSDKVPT